MKYKAAVVQMDTGKDKQENLYKIKHFVEEAVLSGASLVCFPEMVNIQDASLSHLERAERLTDSRTIGYVSELAKKYGIFICLGTILEWVQDKESQADMEKVYNTSVLFGVDGEIITMYRKCHLFDISTEDGKEYKESDTVKPGEMIVNTETKLGNLGIAICYDLRFPEQFRTMTRSGMQVLLLPASFTKETGMAHWETLIRARAIENGCYVLASNQCGEKMEYEAYGHSMIVDPWGRVLAKADMSETILYGEIDLDYVSQVRNQLPSTIL